MQDGLKPGDFLVFQLESGFAMMRLLAEANGIWHVAVIGGSLCHWYGVLVYIAGSRP